MNRFLADSGKPRMRGIAFAAMSVIVLASAGLSPAAGQSVSRVYTTFDTKSCRHTPGRDAEDYGSWRCRGHAGVEVVLGAGDQRLRVSFGRNAAREPAARQTFPAFNSVYSGTIEWRIERAPDGKPRPFATILRWNVKLETDQRDATGRVLVVTRLGPGGVCHVGYVDARANPDANALARRIADESARTFRCGRQKRIVLGKVTEPGMMPGE